MPKKKRWKPIEFRDGPYRVIDANKFAEKCKNPKYVAECLSQYQKWRKGEGEYEWDGDDPCDGPDAPFCTAALSIVEDAAIGFLFEYDKQRKAAK